MSQRSASGSIRTLIAFGLLLLVSANGAAQRMPLSLVEGTSYVRRTIAADGSERACHFLDVGRAEIVGSEMLAELVIRPCQFSADGGKTLRTTVQCRLEDAEMAMNFFAFGGADGSRVRIQVTSGDFFSPGVNPADASLPDVRLDVAIEEGAWGWLGGRTRIDLENRVVTSPSGAPRSAGYSITETVRLRAYVLGVRVRNARYRSEEIYAPGGALIRHAVTGADGTITILERAASASNGPAPSLR